MIYYGLYDNLTWLIHALRTNFGAYQVNDLLNRKYYDFPATWIDNRYFAIFAGYLQSTSTLLLTSFASKFVFKVQRVFKLSEEFEINIFLQKQPFS